jgi:hypothetical protein
MLSSSLTSQSTSDGIVPWPIFFRPILSAAIHVSAVTRRVRFNSSGVVAGMNTS